MEEEVQTGGKFLGRCLGEVWYVNSLPKTDVGYLPALEEKKKGSLLEFS